MTADGGIVNQLWRGMQVEQSRFLVPPFTLGESVFVGESRKQEQQQQVHEPIQQGGTRSLLADLRYTARPSFPRTIDYLVVVQLESSKTARRVYVRLIGQVLLTGSLVMHCSGSDSLSAELSFMTGPALVH